MIMYLFMFSLLLLVSLNDRFNEAVTNNVVLIQFDMGDTIDTLQDIEGLGQSALLVFRQIYLRQITRYDRLGIRTDTRQEHFQLQVRGILRLIQDNEGI